MESWLLEMVSIILLLKIMAKRKAHNRRKVKWGDQQFDSILEFTQSHGVTRGCLHYYLKWGKKFRGHEIIRK